MSAAFSKGTTLNHRRQAAAYVAFCLKADKEPLHPDLSSILHYIQLLGNSFKSLTSVKNYLSGAKTFIRTSGGTTHVFASPAITDLLRGLNRLSTHTTLQAPPVSTSQLRGLFDVLWTIGPEARIARAAILFAYVTFLRQSNFVLTPTASAHLLSRGDIRPVAYGLAVHVGSTKTLHPGSGVIIPIHRVPNSRYCPVAAVIAARSAVPAPLSAPLFLTSKGRPLTAYGLTGIMRSGLAAAGHPSPGLITLHSLRRSGAQAAALAGEGQDQLMTHGTWTGPSLYTYVPRPLFTSVPWTMSDILGSHTAPQ